MNINMGNVDRTFRVILGFVVLALGFFYSSAWGLLGLIPLATAIAGWCPLYSALHISTMKKSGNPGA